MPPVGELETVRALRAIRDVSKQSHERFAMRTALVVLVLLALMVAGGWVVFNYQSGSATVEFRTDEAQQDVEKVIEDTRSMVNDMQGRGPDSTTTIENRTQLD